MKDVELKLISELIKNSRRSDRELAKAIGISQPTVSRVRLRLEKEGLIDYSAVPNLAKLGFEIIAIILGTRNFEKHSQSELPKATDFIKRHPNTIFVASGLGLGGDSLGISIHKNFAEYSKFMQELKAEWADIMNVGTFLISLKGNDVIQPLSFKSFADYLKKEEEPK
ncbi:hypothetical protein A3K79_07460 [Candidatus Bathyarchaeota archaeon RBG_13_46_16b]|nr:MAG: hypothetical protein A3K79_07460 [Candidatus Bathyarchaeota archaeon RBG_13_46_16b]